MFNDNEMNKTKLDIYESKKTIKREDVVSKYPNGAALYYKPGENEDEIVIFGHAVYREDWGPSRYRSLLVHEGYTSLLEEDECRIEVLQPAKERCINIDNPRIMTFESFYRDYEGIMSYVGNMCVSVFGYEKTDIHLFITQDEKNKCLNYYGYSYCGLWNEEEFQGMWDRIEDITFAEYERRSADYKEAAEKQKKDNNEEDMADEDFCGDLVINDLIREGALPGICRKIKKWLKKTSFKKFCKAITDRVMGQEETEKLALIVYEYLENIARGKKTNNNVLMAAPSGCGKTETYRAIKEYFRREIPNLVVEQVDLSVISATGYKGADPGRIVYSLKEEDDGIGIIFLDEFDKKLIPSISSGGDNVNLEVQSQILTIVEGRNATYKNGKTEITVDTSNTLFFGMGAFDACRRKKSKGEKHMGFGQENTEGADHYERISREDMVDTGGCYELIGRFPHIINYHKLSDEVVDRIIDEYLKKISDEIKCKVILSDDMHTFLHEEANGNYGCRILDSYIRSASINGLLEIRINDGNPSDYTIHINGKEEYSLEKRRKEACDVIRDEFEEYSESVA